MTFETEGIVKSDRPVPLAWTLLQGLLIFVATVGIPLAVAALVSEDSAMLVLVPLALGVGTYALRVPGRSALFAMVMALLPAALGVIGVSDIIGANGTSQALGIAVADAPDHPDAEVLGFTDASPAMAYLHAWTDYGVAYFVAPLAAAGWSAAEPVTAWFACDSTDAAFCKTVLATPMRAGVRVAGPKLQAYRREIHNAALALGLIADPDAPVLYLTEAPATRAEGAVTGIIGLPLAFYLLWAVPVVILRGARRARTRR